MNILIPYSWLKEYLETKASPEKIGECLSLCGASVEKITKLGQDKIFDIEVTSNRVDMMSVSGVAREAAAILPQFGIKAKLKKDPYKLKLKTQNSKLKTTTKSLDLKIKIRNSSLCPRFSAIVLENVKVKESPSEIKNKLTKVGLRPLNNVIDISNLLMHELGQPVHIFDYEKIGKRQMTLREARKAEKLTTLDGKTHTLPGKDIVIEDGGGRLIDLCGIMGGQNSAVDQQTKKIILFIQNYEPYHIRQTSMVLGQRTQAATLFEKKVDPELVMPTLIKGIKLLKKYAQAKEKSKIIDFYSSPYQPKEVKISLQLIKQYLGLPIQLNKVKEILQSLGFKLSVTNQKLPIIKAKVPSWRAEDICIPEDLIEEVTRIYGYHNLPSFLPPLFKIPQQSEQNFYWEDKARFILKNWGLTETLSYSMQSRQELEKFNLQPQKHLKIKNPLSEDWLFMRTKILPSLLSIVKQNSGKREKIRIFEMAKVYLPRKAKLPQENLRLNLLLNGQKFFQLKGLCQALLEEMGIKVEFKKFDQDSSCWQINRTAEIKSGRKKLGLVGQLKKEVINKFELKKNIAAADLDFDQISRLANRKKTYRPIPKHPPVIEDLTFVLRPKTSFEEMVTIIKKTSPLIHQVRLLDVYKQSFTFRLSFLNPRKNLTKTAVAKIRKKVILQVKKRELGKLKA